MEMQSTISQLASTKQQQQQQRKTLWRKGEDTDPCRNPSWIQGEKDHEFQANILQPPEILDP